MRDSLDARVAIDGAPPTTLSPKSQLIFGRDGGDGVVAIAPNDPGVSQRAGRLAVRDGDWWIENLSANKSLSVEYPDIVRWVTVPQQSSHVLTGNSTIIITGRDFKHAIRITLASNYSARFVLTATTASRRSSSDVCSEEDKTALAAVAAGYLRRFPRHDPQPLSYADAAALVGWTEVALRRRLENLRDRLRERDVVDLYGPHSARLLSEWAIDNGVIDVADAARLGRCHSPG